MDTNTTQTGGPAPQDTGVTNAKSRLERNDAVGTTGAAAQAFTKLRNAEKVLGDARALLGSGRSLGAIAGKGIAGSAAAGVGAVIADRQSLLQRLDDLLGPPKLSAKLQQALPFPQNGGELYDVVKACSYYRNLEPVAQAGPLWRAFADQFSNLETAIDQNPRDEAVCSLDRWIMETVDRVFPKRTLSADTEGESCVAQGTAASNPTPADVENARFFEHTDAAPNEMDAFVRHKVLSDTFSLHLLMTFFKGVMLVDREAPKPPANPQEERMYAIVMSILREFRPEEVTPMLAKLYNLPAWKNALEHLEKGQQIQDVKTCHAEFFGDENDYLHLSLSYKEINALFTAGAARNSFGKRFLLCLTGRTRSGHMEPPTEDADVEVCKKVLQILREISPEHLRERVRTAASGSYAWAVFLMHLLEVRTSAYTPEGETVRAIAGELQASLLASLLQEVMTSPCAQSACYLALRPDCWGRVSPDAQRAAPKTGADLEAVRSTLHIVCLLRRAKEKASTFSVRQVLSELAELSPEWKVITDHWDLLFSAARGAIRESTLTGRLKMLQQGVRLVGENTAVSNKTRHEWDGL